jgi:hypothetical protein
MSTGEQGQHFAVALAGNWPVSIPIGLLLDDDLSLSAKAVGAIWLALREEPSVERLIELNASPDIKAIRTALAEAKCWGIERWVDRGPRD